MGSPENLKPPSPAQVQLPHLYSPFQHCDQEERDIIPFQVSSCQKRKYECYGSNSLHSPSLHVRWSMRVTSLSRYQSNCRSYSTSNYGVAWAAVIPLPSKVFYSKCWHLCSYFEPGSPQNYDPTGHLEWCIPMPMHPSLLKGHRGLMSPLLSRTGSQQHPAVTLSPRMFQLFAKQGHWILRDICSQHTANHTLPFAIMGTTF